METNIDAGMNIVASLLQNDPTCYSTLSKLRFPQVNISLYLSLYL